MTRTVLLSEKLHSFSHSETRVFARPGCLNIPANYLVHFSALVQSRRFACVGFRLILRKVRAGVCEGPRASQRPNQARHDKIASTRCVGVARINRHVLNHAMQAWTVHVSPASLLRWSWRLCREQNTFLNERRAALESLSMHQGTGQQRHRWRAPPADRGPAAMAPARRQCVRQSPRARLDHP